MIHIEVKRNENGDIIEFHLRGHAELVQDGEDAICAAISMVSQTSILGLHHIANQSMNYYVGKEGEIQGELDVFLSEPITERGQTILETMLLGIKNVADQYSDFVRVSEQ